MPDTGCHSVIERPDSVSRVTPPSTTMTRIIAAQARSQAAMLRSSLVGALREVRVDKAAPLPLRWREAEGGKATWQEAPVTQKRCRVSLPFGRKLNDQPLARIAARHSHTAKIALISMLC